MTDSVEVALSPAAVDFVRQRGNRVYLWPKGGGPLSGFLKASLDEPRGQRTFREAVSQSGVCVLVADDLGVACDA